MHSLNARLSWHPESTFAAAAVALVAAAEIVVVVVVVAAVAAAAMRPTPGCTPRPWRPRWRPGRRRPPWEAAACPWAAAPCRAGAWGTIQ